MTGSEVQADKHTHKVHNNGHVMTYEKFCRLTDWECRKCRLVIKSRATDKSIYRLGVY